MNTPQNSFEASATLSPVANPRPTSAEFGEYSTEQVQLNVTQADGSTVTVDLAIGLAGSVFVVTFHDVTEKVALLQQAQEAVAAKRNFLAFICHELRNPLNGTVVARRRAVRRGPWWWLAGAHTPP